MQWMSCNCAGLIIGFDDSDWGFATVGTDSVQEIRTGIKDAIFQLAGVTALFAGNHNFCGNAIRFDSADWPTIKTWIEAGGRMFIAAEHTGESPTGCLKDMANLNSFLSAMGSSLSYVGGFHDAGYTATPGTAQVAHAGEFTGNLFGVVSGGTTVWLDLGLTVVAVEKLGDGYLFLCGDSNLNSCYNFFKRLWLDSDLI